MTKAEVRTREEAKKAFRNWIEAALKKQLAWSPTYVGNKGGRRVYAVMFEDGTEADYYIDFDSNTIEAY